MPAQDVHRDGVQQTPSTQSGLGCFPNRWLNGLEWLSRLGSSASESENASTLASLNVGLPRDVAWRGQTVHTAVWKMPVQGRRKVRRLNIDGDGQGDLAGHGG